MADVLSQTKNKMLKALEVLQENLSTIRTGRASSSLVENVIIEAYDTKMKLKELSTINTPDSKLIVLTPYDQSISGNISKGIQEANLGLTPIIEGDIIRIIIPPLTEERRRDFVKLVKQRVESTRITIRQIRQDAMDELDLLEEEGEITEDDRRRISEHIEEVNKEMNVEAEKQGETKEAELMQI